MVDAGTSRPAGAQAAVLLEVIIALSLFVAAAGVVIGGLSACVLSVRRLRVQARAADLAVTLLSEIQMGLVPATDDGPNEYEDDEDLADWTWQVIATPAEEVAGAAPMKQVQVVITNTPGNHVYRLYQLMGDEELTAESPPTDAGGRFGGRP